MNPEIIYCEQQSEEWFLAKLGIPSASNFSKILAKGQGKTRKAYMMKLLAEIETGIPQESYQNSSMERGVETEAQAREYYKGYKKVEVEQVGFIKRNGLGCSPDGLIGDDGLLEIKCPDSSTHLEYVLADKMVSVYIPQVQGQLLVTGREWCDFVSFDPRVQKRPFWCIRVERDNKKLKEIKDACSDFIKELNELIEKISIPI